MILLFCNSFSGVDKVSKVKALVRFEFSEFRPRTFITSGSLGVMGAGLPFAIGTQALKSCRCCSQP